MPNPEAERFISKASMIHSEEARISVIATRRATDDRLRSLAEQIRKSSRAREKELDRLAQTRSVLLPTGRDPTYLPEEKRDWTDEAGEEFNSDYVNRVILLHRRAIDIHEDYASAQDSDPELAAFAQKHLPVLRDRLAQAETIARQLD